MENKIQVFQMGYGNKTTRIAFSNLQRIHPVEMSWLENTEDKNGNHIEIKDSSGSFTIGCMKKTNQAVSREGIFILNHDKPLLEVWENIYCFL